MTYELTYTLINSNAYEVSGYTGEPDEVIIPYTYNGLPVTSIGGWAFGGSGLMNITIPDSVTSIGSFAFDNCSSLKSVTIPDSVTSIGDFAFRDCTSLTSVTIGDSVTSIGSFAFSNCHSLMSIVIPNSVTFISDDAFVGCHSLTDVTIPDSVTSIGHYAFAYCDSLISIIIPDSVTSIDSNAFLDCISLTSVTIGNSVTSIGWMAFSGCTSLTDIILLSAFPPSLSNDVFYGIPEAAKFYCFSSSIDLYKTATSWNEYLDKFVADNIRLYFIMSANAQKKHFSTATNLVDSEGLNSIAQKNALAAGENSVAFGVNHFETLANDYNLALSVTKGYNNTEWYNTEDTGSGATDDIVPIEPLTEPEYYKDGTTEITSVHDITFTSTGAHGSNTHTEGNENLALGNNSHAEGFKTYAAAGNSHVEGTMNVVFGVDSHSEGARNISVGQASHTEGMRNTALGKGSHIEGFKNQTGKKSTWSHIEGEGNLIKGMASHGEGAGNVIFDDIEVIQNEDGTVTEKNHIAYSHIEGYNNKISASKSHAEGEGNILTTEAAHVEGKNNRVKGKYAHGEGYNNTVLGQSGHVEGASSDVAPDTITDADSAITEYQAASKKFNLALGLGSHSEGYNTLSLNSGSHSEGKETIAKGEASHTEGYRTEANARYSHAEGFGTIANGNYVHVQGQYNLPSTSGYADIVGNGAAEARSNAYTLKWNGDGHYAGDLYVKSSWVQNENGVLEATGKKVLIKDDLIPVETKLNDLTVVVDGLDNIGNGTGTRSIQQVNATATNQDAAAFNSATAGGKYATAFGLGSNAATQGTIASGYYTHAQGSNYQSVRGRANLITSGKNGATISAGLFADIVGGGDDKDAGATRANIYTLDWKGNAHFAGDVYVGATWAENAKGTNIVTTTDAKKKLATEEYIDARITKDATGDIKINNNTTITGTLTIGKTTLTEAQLIKILNFIDSIEG